MLPPLQKRSFGYVSFIYFFVLFFCVIVSYFASHRIVENFSSLFYSNLQMIEDISEKIAVPHDPVPYDRKNAP